jgi:lysophospholipase L1-like esterase
MIKTKQPRKRLPTTPKPETNKLMKDLLKEFLPGDLKIPIWGKPTGSTTQKPTVAPTPPDEQMKTQFAKLLKKFGIQNNVSANALTGGSTSTTSEKNLANDIGNEIKMHNPTSTGSDVMSNKPSLPTPDLSPQPSLPPSKLLRPPLRLAPLAEPPPQQQKQPTQSQLITTSPSLPTQQKISTSSTNHPYLNHEPDQKLANIQRSFIPTVKPQKPVKISQEASFPQSQQQVANPPYSYSSYSSNNNNPYVSPQTQRTINVLCFGDSLTSGFYNHGRGKHPYSIKLNQLLNPQGSHRYHIETRGVVGEMAHGSMTKRLPKVLNEGTHYDWVLILGGTNDVAHVKNFGDDQDFTRQLIGVWSPKIVKDIEKLHETARSYGSRTVLMTIPETAYELWPDFVSIRNMRLSVNAALRKYATEVRDTTVLCDLAYKLPRSTLSHEMEKLYWNDHIHLNPVGYNKMAEVIEQCIQPYLS